ncbi:MAG: hypothetical protein HZA50_02130 [Planctomycetes bacterium]|nr:hypothetical protein [Planctomycetota bacterium]
MFLPIVFIHYHGQSKDPRESHLPYILAQAHLTNPGLPVILITDKGQYDDYVVKVDINSLGHSVAEFDKVYRHMNTNPDAYERFCFQRWFLTLELLRQIGQDRCVCFDSDVMVYTNVAQENDRLGKYDLTVTYGMSPQCNYIGSRVGLERFCDYIMRMYTSPDILARLQAEADEIRSRRDGGICDMTAFRMYGQENPGRVGEIGLVVDGEAYDHNIQMACPEGGEETCGRFEMMNNVKAIRMINRTPFCRHERHGDVRMHILHFQGYSKPLIPIAFNESWGSLDEARQMAKK